MKGSKKRREEKKDFIDIVLLRKHSVHIKLRGPPAWAGCAVKTSSELLYINCVFSSGCVYPARKPVLGLATEAVVKAVLDSVSYCEKLVLKEMLEIKKFRHFIYMKNSKILSIPKERKQKVLQRTMIVTRGNIPLSL